MSSKSFLVVVTSKCLLLKGPDDYCILVKIDICNLVDGVIIVSCPTTIITQSVGDLVNKYFVCD